MLIKGAQTLSVADYQLVEGATHRFIVEFNTALGENAGWRDLVRMVEQARTYMDPRTGKLTILWSESDPEMQRDDGEVIFEALKMRGIELVTDQYVKGFSETLPRLRLPAVRETVAEHVRGMGQAVEISQGRMVWRILVVGDTTQHGLCYDNQPFFHTDHPGKNSFGQVISQSNLFDGMPLNADNLETVIQRMITYRTADGRKVGNRWDSGQDKPSFILHHGAALSKTARKLATKNELDPNIFAGTFIPRLVDSLEGPYAEHWYPQFIHDDAKPVAMVDEGAVLIPTIGADTEPGRRHNRAEWIARAGWGMTYDKWHCMAKCRP